AQGRGGGARDGGFIDDATSDITLEMVTFNAVLNIFSVLEFSFVWKAGGNIAWDYNLNTISVDRYTGE
ncbi:hypothetical protein T484DRAFT_1778915, partial [Baffinella frigidus]